MIKTFFGTGTLETTGAFLAALIIGVLFGFALEQAGFGSSRKLAGMFYFEDMTVIKVMFSAVITAMLGLSYFQAAGLIGPDELYFMPTVYGAQILGGLIFGVGFVMGGWCPGTAAVGLASGKLDALVFFGGAVLGSIGFNELFPVIQPLYTWGSQGVVFIYQTLNLSLGSFALIFTLVAVACFWGVEFLERRRGKVTRGRAQQVSHLFQFRVGGSGPGADALLRHAGAVSRPACGGGGAHRPGGRRRRPPGPGRIG